MHIHVGVCVYSLLVMINYLALYHCEELCNFTFIEIVKLANTLLENAAKSRIFW